MPRAAIVGYTNAGKSSILNVITLADVFAEDKLFATLDPTTRRLVTKAGVVLLTDTVGFVRNLPHGLVEAFKATLEEAADADILVHVLDAADGESEVQYETTRKVLSEIGADTSHSVIVYNKIDKVEEKSVLEFLARRHPGAVFCSAKTGEGLEALKEAINAALNAGDSELLMRIPQSQYGLVSLLYREASVLSEEHEEGTVLVRGKVPERLMSRLKEFIVEK
jgi:GTP-binding protein HflX